jgi:transcriptional regulator with XRE-family HTH domain
VRRAAEGRPQGPAKHFIRDWRLHRGLSLDAVAKRSGLTGSMISQLERGRARYYQLTLQKVAEALDVKPWMLLAGPPAELSLMVFRAKLKFLGLDLDEEPARRLQAFLEQRPLGAGFMLGIAAQESSLNSPYDAAMPSSTMASPTAKPR